MLNYDTEKKHDYYDAIMKSLDEYSYRNKRYNIEFAIAIGLCNVNVDFKDFIKNKRKTDTLIPLEENMCCLVLDCAPAESAVKATSNMQVSFHDKYSERQLFTGVVSSKDYDSDQTMVDSLFDILEYSIANNMEGLIADVHNMGHSL